MLLHKASVRYSTSLDSPRNKTANLITVSIHEVACVSLFVKQIAVVVTVAIGIAVA